MREDWLGLGEHQGHHDLERLLCRGVELACVPPFGSHIMPRDHLSHLVEVCHGSEVRDIGRELPVAVPRCFPDVLCVLPAHFPDQHRLNVLMYGARARLDLEYPVYWAHELANEGGFTSVVVLTASLVFHLGLVNQLPSL